jgi:probable HAF family extracellular repeat protein
MPTGMIHSTAVAFTPNGDVIGTVWNNKGETRGGVWSQKGKTFTSLSAPKDHKGTSANGVSGDIIVGYAHRASEEGIMPVLWKNGQPNVLTIPANYQGRALAVNANREIIGETFDGKQIRGVIWQSGHMKELGTGSDQVEPQAINASGGIVGYKMGKNTAHALYWSSGTAKPVELSPNSDRALAFDINDKGQVVGYVGKTNPIATLWQNGKSTDLNALLPKNSGWQLMAAKAISEDGKTIIGIGQYKNKILGYRLTL